jgi:hypothetical protein
MSTIGDEAPRKPPSGVASIAAVCRSHQRVDQWQMNENRIRFPDRNALPP